MAISKINSLALGSVAKVNSLLKASMAKINSLVNVLFGDSYSIVLDGTNDHVTAHGAAGDPFSGDVGSISLWFKLDTVSATKHLFCITSGNNFDSGNFIRAFYHASQNKIYTNHKGNGSLVAMVATDAVENNGWHHYVFTWDTTAGNGFVYIDGSATVNGENLQAVSFEEGGFDTLHIGTKDGSIGPWDGNVNDFAIYNDVLSESEVGTIYNSGSPNDLTGLGSSGGLISYWKMENNTDDSGSEGNVITLVNGASYDSGDVP